MMFRTLVCTAVLIFMVAERASSSMLTLTSVPPDLSSLTPGDVVTFGVDLSGLGPTEALDFLAVTIAFDSPPLGTPTITPGAIVPDVTGFSAGASPGFADGLYDIFFSLGGTPITSNGTFFTFDVPVIGVGGGSASFDFVDSDGVDTATGALLPLVDPGTPLTFTSVPPGGVDIPEPSAVVVWALCLATTGLGLAWRKRWTRG